MTSPSPRKSQTRSSMFTISLILGLLLIPLSAVAATALISNDGETDEGEAAAIVVDVPETTITSTTEAVAAETVFVTEPPTATRGDLEAACGEEGFELVEREAAETITDLEQAALDALRQICAEEGLELPGPPAPPPVVRTVKVVDSSASATTDDTIPDDSSVSGDDDQYDDDHDDEDEEDDHDEDEEDDHDDEDEEDEEDDEDDD
ncbi:MAG: hypothetical protein ACNYZH_07285 [Acidimicrobiia bacterium]